jgi:ubiquinone/menaquinone biosynthesis C-methylase UbiE
MSAPQPPTEADHEALRSYFEGELAQGIERFLEPRLEVCPWCGSADLAKRVRARDVWQGKPGRFVMDECRACGHVFQNPRLTIEGLDFYYNNFYDGLGQHHMETTFDAAGEVHRQRAEMVKAELAKSGATPKRWLDVGTGYGHFAKHAREVLPGTTLDGLDMGVAVTLGAERGWLDTAHQGLFPELAESLAGQYDVVSMHHYLEHTLDPRAELDAAAKVLAPGGLLLIEVPDPSWRFAKTFGRWWIGLMQPQHQHLVPMDNLLQALTERGFTTVATASGQAHMGIDAVFAFPLMFDKKSASPAMFGVGAPDTSVPWLPGRSRSPHRSRARALWSKAVLTMGFAVDKALTAVAHRTDNGDAYRVLARRDA